MTTLHIYPLFTSSVNAPNLRHYATSKGFTVLSQSSNVVNENNASVKQVLVLQETLTTGQKTAIQNIFQGFAFVEFI